MLVRSVDDSPVSAVAAARGADSGTDMVSSLTGAIDGFWLGVVVPKRHARRAVTRTLLKRQMRAAVQARAGGMPSGIWVVRLRAGFERAAFPSAASAALRDAARAELDGLLARCNAPFVAPALAVAPRIGAAP